MPPRFRRLFEGPDEIDYSPDPMGKIGEGARDIRDPAQDDHGQRLFQDFRDAFAEGRPLPELFGPGGTLELKQGIGLQSRNRRPDVAKVETFLDLLGEHDTAPTEGPTGYYSIRLEDSLKAYQARNGLKPDGVVNPQGETLGRIKQDLTRKLGPAALKPPRPAGSILGSVPRSLRSEVLKGPLDGADLPAAPRAGAQLIPTQATSGPPGSGRELQSQLRNRRARDEFLKISRDSERRFNQELDRIERRIKEIEDDGRKKGLVIAAKALRHFREGSGTTMSFSRDWLRRFNAVRAGERRVQRHFENWLTGKKRPGDNSPHERIIGALLRLKDGETLDRRSEWVAPVAVPWWKQSRSDLHAATGTSRIQSNGSFRLVRKGNKILVVGKVDHHWNDIYDWDKGEETQLSLREVFRHDDA